MKTMIVSDFAILRSALLQLAGICLVIGVFMGWAMGSVAGAAAAIAAMVPFMMLFSLAATDEQNGWDRFRLTLPLTRRQVVWGRYASLGLIILGTIAFAALVSFAFLAVAAGLQDGMLPDGLTPAENPPAAIVGSIVGAVCVISVGMDVALPLIMRFGMTKATRIVPAIVVAALAFGVAFFDGGAVPIAGDLAGLVQWLDTGNNYLVAAVAIIVAAALLYVVSAAVAAKLYEKREF